MMHFERNEAEAPGWPQMRSWELGRALGLILGSTKAFPGHPQWIPLLVLGWILEADPVVLSWSYRRLLNPGEKWCFNRAWTEQMAAGAVPAWACACPAPPSLPCCRGLLCAFSQALAGCWFSLAGGGRFAASLALPRPPHP